MADWDVIVVGARCGGATTAQRFARSGRSVLMLDKGMPDSPVLSTHAMGGPAITALDQLGVLNDALAAGAGIFRKLLIEFDGKAYVSPFTGEPDYNICLQRSVLDPLLVKAAVKAGVTVQYGSAVQELLWEDDRVVGVQVREKDGSTREERAGLVVGADGRHSVVAHKVNAVEYDVIPGVSAVYYTYFRGMGATRAGADAMHHAAGSDCHIQCAPCNDGLHVLMLFINADEFAEIGTQGSDAFDARLRTVPAFRPRLANAERVSRLYPASSRELRGYFRKPFGPGWVLVGDAGHFSNPASGIGIGHTFRSGELAHQHVEQAWADGKPAETYLDQYQKTRDEESTEGYHFSQRLGKVNSLYDAEFSQMIISALGMTQV